MEFWGASRSLPGRTAKIAKSAESEGWTGLTFTDSQNLSGDPYVALAIAAAATTRLRMSTGVTNPWTRHPAVTASAITCVDIESAGRAELGIGRGDSALAYIGLAPAPVSRLKQYLELLRAYLRGDAVPMEQATDAATNTLGRTLPLGEAPESSRIEWLGRHYPDHRPVPVFVTSSGPKVIEVAATHADRVTLAVGADPERVRWAVERARAANPAVRIGAYVNVLVDDDPDKARTMALGTIASFARFSAMHGSVQGPVRAEQRTVLEGLSHEYQMTHHFETGTQGSVITPEFADRYAILGPAAYCADRLIELQQLGVDRFHVIGASREASREVAVATRRRFVEGVLAKLSHA